MEEMIKTKDLKYKYKTTYEEKGKTITKEITALDDINISIKKGSFVAVLGHNGSGKSTLAKHINALVKPTSGTIWVKGMDSKDESKLWDIRQTAGMVFQNPDNQIVATIVEEDVAFGPENLGIPRDEIIKRVDAALKCVSMEKYRKNEPARLSGGQKQRVAIAGVLAMKPDCIVFDEPTAMLDPEGRKDVMETIKKLNKEENITCILITHYMNEAVQADRVIIIDDGRIVMDGTPREVFVQVDKVKGYGLDVPQATEIAYELRKKGIDIPADIMTAEEMVGAICRLK
ncbi:MAG: energy-coupling factor transporter ATPase [Clostridia bacterium]|nr:energy-coupling factor transporter ATPase [Clostridia bacterium]MCI2000633.1 energy-coupling factor transporter ATPase [Clostridia bacterium]MCI2015294.1 energy-coupling factor transporter ATPase [Clostridia bacterium]